MVRYAFLGPAGTFSEEALFSLDIPDLEAVECSSIAEVFEAVERGRADGGVVPIENSIEGSVPATLDGLAFDSSLEIQGEFVLDIHFSVVVAPGTKLADVTPCRRASAGERSMPSLARAPSAGPPRHGCEFECRGGPDRCRVAGDRSPGPLDRGRPLRGRDPPARCRGLRGEPDALRGSRQGNLCADGQGQDVARAVHEGRPLGSAAHDLGRVRLRRDQPDQDPVAPRPSGSWATTCSSSTSKATLRTPTCARRWTACA